MSFITISKYDRGGRVFVKLNADVPGCGEYEEERDSTSNEFPSFRMLTDDAGRFSVEVPVKFVGSRSPQSLQLVSGIDSATEAITVSSPGTTFAQHRIIKIDNEYIKITSSSTAAGSGQVTLQVEPGGRGAFGSAASGHSSGTTVSEVYPGSVGSIKAEITGRYEMLAPPGTGKDRFKGELRLTGDCLGVSSYDSDSVAFVTKRLVTRVKR